ncbi:MAG: GUN4 domain-containing protein [Xenococcaceae cyanobacterium]
MDGRDPMFDVFLAHNSVDKPQVRAIAKELRKRGLKPWLDEEQIAPGDLFQEAIQRAIPQIKAAAICIGPKGLGKWQVIELQALISQFINKGSRVIPVLLPGVDKIPDNLLFLQQFNWISCESVDEIAYNLEWGITGVKPKLEQKSSTYTTLCNKPDDVKLRSKKGTNYTKLRALLASREWKKADQETYRLMIQTMDREQGEWLDSEDLEQFPCEDLRIINYLWMYYSNGKFGFSVQKEIYESLGGTKEYNRSVWNSFGDCVGWRKGGRWLDYSELTFDLNAPQAHLPVVSTPPKTIGDLSSFLTQKLVTCKI